jgi:hypothetical protein
LGSIQQDQGIANALKGNKSTEKAIRLGREIYAKFSIMMLMFAILEQNKWCAGRLGPSWIETNWVFHFYLLAASIMEIQNQSNIL